MSVWAMAAWVAAAPAALAALLMLTAWIEARFVAPQERAELVYKALITHREPHEVEEVATRLAQQALPADGFRRRDPSRAAPRIGASSAARVAKR